MEKLKLESPDFTQQNIDRIAELFPSVITEIKDDNGKLKKAINFTTLKQLLSDDIVDGEECYEFTWVGKKQSIIEGNRPIRKTLRPAKEESKNWDTTENLYIEGDNLEVLKLLQNSYLNSIKMIYIDPPYNTGNDFVYRDNFAVSREEFEDEMGVYDEDENRLIPNPKSEGRYHSRWCSMMYPRLQLARNLLTDDGVIFISIDDNEVDNLRKICDEVFGESNFIGCLILQTATDNNPGQIKTEHEYMVCFAKNKSKLNYWFSNNENAKLIIERYNILKQKYSSPSDIEVELRKWIKSNEKKLIGVTHYDNVDDNGVFHDGDIANTVFGGYEYEVIHPVTKKPCKIPEKGFRYPETTLLEMIKNNEVMFGENESTLIKPKKRIENAKDVLRSVIYEDGRTSTKKFEFLMGRDIFQNPKSDTILSRIINFVTKENDIVLDFFSGSGTIAESVINNNFFYDKNLRFILVQLPDNLDESVIKADNKAKKTFQNSIKFLDSINKPHVITEIGKERIRRAGKKIEDELQAKSKSGELFAEQEEVKSVDTGFRVLKLDDTNMKDVYYSAGEYSQQMLLDLESNIKEDRTDLDLLYGVLLDWGVSLSLPHIREIVGGKKVHFVNETDLVACFEENVNETVVREIAKRKPLRVVFRDSSFGSSPEKINVSEIFKTLSPDTTIKVI